MRRSIGSPDPSRILRGDLYGGLSRTEGQDASELFSNQGSYTCKQPVRFSQIAEYYLLIG